MGYKMPSILRGTFIWSATLMLPIKLWQAIGYLDASISEILNVGVKVHLLTDEIEYTDFETFNLVGS